MKRILVLLLLLILACGMALAEGNRPQYDPGAAPYQARPTPVPRPNIAMPGWKEIGIEANTINAWMPFFNPEQNEGWYDLTFALWVALPEEAIAEGIETVVETEEDTETGETREVVYAKLSQSGLVPPGLYLQNVTLFQPVPKGSYKAYVSMQPYYVEDGTPTMTCGRVNVDLYAN